MDKKKKRVYDWKKIKMSFVKSNLSIVEFAKQNGIPNNTLRKRVASEKWIDERDRIGTITVQKAEKKLIEDTSSQLAKFEDKT